MQKLPFFKRTTNMKSLSTIILSTIFLFATSVTNAQTGYSVADAVPVTSFPTTFTGVVSDDANNLGQASLGAGICSNLTPYEWVVYKLVLAQEGALRMSMTNYCTQCSRYDNFYGKYFSCYNLG